MKDELERIRSASRGDAADTATSRRWDPDNPGNAAMRAERARMAIAMLTARGVWPLDRMSTLEIGCGAGQVIRDLRTEGAATDGVVGVELIEERLTIHDAPVVVGNGAARPVADRSFSVVLMFTVFSSILEALVRAQVAAEIDRVLRPGGTVLVYDFRFADPRNKHTVGMSRRRLSALFPGYGSESRTLSVLPPLARRLGRLTSRVYPVLASVPAIRTHIMIAFTKPG
jgi:SAM-dependent methyltransferase